MRARDIGQAPATGRAALRGIGNAIWGAPVETIDTRFEDAWIARDDAPDARDRLRHAAPARCFPLRRLLGAGAALLRTALTRRKR